MAASQTIPAIVITEGVNALSVLPKLREEGTLVSPAQLKAIMHITCAYLESPNRAAPPSRDVMRDAIQSLLPVGERLARKWRKQQLTQVLLKWVVHAMRLRPPHAQKDLRVRVSVSDANPKEISHTCYLEDEDTGNVASFLLDSPTPVGPVRPEEARAREEEIPRLSTPLSEFNDIEGMDEAFLREIDEIAKREDLAAIPTSFRTPRVPNEVATENSEGSRRWIERRPVCLPHLQSVTNLLAVSV